MREGKENRSEKQKREEARLEKKIRAKRKAGGLVYTLLIFMIFLQAINKSCVY